MSINFEEASKPEVATWEEFHNCESGWYWDVSFIVENQEVKKHLTMLCEARLGHDVGDGLLEVPLTKSGGMWACDASDEAFATATANFFEYETAKVSTLPWLVLDIPTMKRALPVMGGNLG